MKVYTKIVIDMLTGEELESRSYEYSGPVALAKGDEAKGAALNNAKTGQAENTQLFGEGQNAQNELLPFLKQEMLNPQGFGQPTMNALTTQAGQTASGSLANAEEQAKLRASRTGNPSSESAIIANSARSAANAQTDAQRQNQILNAQEKLKQQQAGAAGLGEIGSTDLKDALDSLGLSNESVNAWSGANKSAGNLWSNAFMPMLNDVNATFKAGGATIGV